MSALILKYSIEAKEQAETEPNAKSSTKQQTNVVTSKNKQHKKD